jgi:hypothetical protein
VRHAMGIGSANCGNQAYEKLTLAKLDCRDSLQEIRDVFFTSKLSVTRGRTYRRAFFDPVRHAACSPTARDVTEPQTPNPGTPDREPDPSPDRGRDDTPDAPPTEPSPVPVQDPPAEPGAAGPYVVRRQR